MINNLFAQEQNTSTTNKKELKLQKLEQNALRAEVKVNLVKAKLESADSLITVGKDMEIEAISQIIALEKEGKEYTKQQNYEYKLLNKRLKRASDEERKQITKEIKELDLKYKLEIKELEKKLKIEYKKLQKGMLNQEKGKEKLKQYNKTLDEYIDLLRDAEEKLEEFKLEMD
ncbi:MAG: hypothetical protein AB7S50_12575 [Bacteroidales bacterium]